MSQFDSVSPSSPIRAILDLSNVDELKHLLVLVPEARPTGTRKAEVIEAIAGCLTGGGLRGLWERLGALERSAVAEAAYECDGLHRPAAFAAKYGKSPSFEKNPTEPWKRRPTLLRLFFHPIGREGLCIPREVRSELRSFVPKPPEAQLESLAELPVETVESDNSPESAGEKSRTFDDSDEAPLIQRLTEQAAIQDLRTTLRLIDQGKLAVSATTQLPSTATMTLLSGLLRDGDFFDLTAKAKEWDPEIGPIKGFSWPLLLQAAKLATLRTGKLTLTTAGRAALEKPPAEVLRGVWSAWLGNQIIDEFSRIDTIKGQKGKGKRGLTAPGSRRLTIRDALAKCPVGRWVETAKFSRYMQSAGFRFEITRDAWSLYICEPEYGSLGYEGCGGWNMLQERYLLCLLFEYAAPLGMIDIAYTHPAGARNDYTGQWGADDLSFLSRYDGLEYFRLTPLGAFILGLQEKYEPPATAPTVALSVLPKRQIRIDRGELDPEEALLLEKYADRDDERLWSLSERKALKAVELGAQIGELRTFLKARDPQPLPEAVESFLASVEQRGAACVCKGTCLLVQCASAQIAETIAGDSRASALCQRTGDRGLVVPAGKEEAFRKAINGLGYGMPRV